MSKFKVFIDGESGTTGLQIKQRLENHASIDVISIEYEKRKDIAEKKKILSEVDITIFCLPDEAAKDTAKLISDSQLDTRILDASSAHRTLSDWVYGFAELHPDQRKRIENANRVSNPGCYATGAIALLKPLSAMGGFKDQSLVSINAISGYSGGGKNLIEKFKSSTDSDCRSVPVIGLYGLNLNHKHTLEIQTHAGLGRRPLFIPSVADFYQGMLVHLQIDLDHLNKALALKDLYDLFADYYRHESQITLNPLNENTDDFAPYFSPHGIEGQNRIEIDVFGSDEFRSAILIAKLDNLGKGASGAAVQNLNIMLGLPELEAVAL